ncbi:MAG: cytochrome c maturation protein CcmE [Nitrospinae bacterium]|nr:cytochrome c maturation protein CcmE [Nitrospinota bacterium]
MTDTNEPVGPAPQGGAGSAQKKIVVGAVIIVAAIVSLMYSAIDTSASYYVTVCEARNMDAGDLTNRSLRLEGVVAPGSVVNDGKNLQYTFDILEDPEKNPDCADKVAVFHKGVLPDLMQPGAVPENMVTNLKVIVEGRFDAKGAFVADRVLTSCPSRYNAAEDVKKPV